MNYLLKIIKTNLKLMDMIIYEYDERNRNVPVFFYYTFNENIIHDQCSMQKLCPHAFTYVVARLFLFKCNLMENHT